MSDRSNMPLFTPEEQLLIEAAAALKLAHEMAVSKGGLPIDNTEIQTGLMELVHKMRTDRLGLSACGI